MSRFWVYLLYNLLLPVVLLIGFPRFVMKGIQRGGLARNFRQRLGHYRPEVREQLSRSGNLWIHAVSVGEVLVALKLIRELRQQRPEASIVLSTTTTTGYRLADEETSSDREHITVIHNPVDLPWIVHRVLNRIRPERLILVEAEVWPNLVQQAVARRIPVILVNARLSDRSESRFRKFGALTRPIFSQIDRVGVPFEGDIDRWEGLGIERDRITVTGSVKFDEDPAARPESQVAELASWLAENEFPDKGKILLAGSTHAGEEALIGRAWLTLRERFPDLQYVVVPRHAERAREVASDLRTLGCHPVLKQPLGEASPEERNPDAAPVWIANTTGELRAWYHLSDLVVVGKSFLGRGGQNPVEPVVAGKPVVVGPHMQNFRAIVADLLRAGGIRQLEGQDLAEELGRLQEHPEEAGDLARKGAEALARHSGASRRTAELVLA